VANADTIIEHRLDAEGADPLMLAGGYPLRLDLTDNRNGMTLTTSRVVVVVTRAAVDALGADTDSDGDGVFDAAEGVADSDDDGIPDYLDHDSTLPSALPNQTGEAASQLMLQTNAGLRLRVGHIAAMSGAFAAMISECCVGCTLSPISSSS